MASSESQRLRATFVNNHRPSSAPLEAQRREWEQLAAQAPLPPGVLAEPVSLAGVACEWVGDQDRRDRVVLVVHGGGFTTGSCVTHRELAARLAVAAGARALVVDYRLAPEHPYPAAVEDVLLVYRSLLATGTAPQQVFLAADSAGAAIAVSALLRLRDAASPLPAAAVLLSPWLDLALAGESMRSRAEIDPLVSREALLAAARAYLAGQDPDDPQASPVYAELRGLPPMLVQVGDHEVLLSDSLRLSERARADGVEVALEVWPEMWHVWHGSPGLPEAQRAMDRIGAYVRARAGTSARND